MNRVDDVMERARSAPWEPELPSAQWIRARGRRRRTRRTLTAAAAVAAACSLAAVVVPMGVRWFAQDTDAASGDNAALVFIRDGADTPSSQVIGPFEQSQDGCLTLAGDPAVLPRGSRVDGDQLHLGGNRPGDVRIGESVTVGGAVFGLSGTDVIDNLVDPETRAQFDSCVRASGSDSWVLITGS